MTLASHEFLQSAPAKVRTAAASARVFCPGIKIKRAHCSETLVNTLEDTLFIGIGTITAVLRFHQLAVGYGVEATGG